jgi:23S rRNA pseudouridine2605 synthase
MQDKKGRKRPGEGSRAKGNPGRKSREGDRSSAGRVFGRPASGRQASEGDMPPRGGSPGRAPGLKPAAGSRASSGATPGRKTTAGSRASSNAPVRKSRDGDRPQGGGSDRATPGRATPGRTTLGRTKPVARTRDGDRPQGGGSDRATPGRATPGRTTLGRTKPVPRTREGYRPPWGGAGRATPDRATPGRKSGVGGRATGTDWHKAMPGRSREPERLRLNQYIAKSGICSRREADEYILSGHITVNEKVVKELGARVSVSDVVRFKGKRLNPERKVYVLLNKPKDYITTVDDPYAKKTVMDLVRNSCRERIYPVGRLDRNTTGVLLFTNDGDLTKKLTHPSHKVTKIYEAGLDRNLEKADLEKIAGGVVLEDGRVEVDEIGYIDPADRTKIGISLHSGKNRIIRRIFDHFDYKVIRLDRVFFAGLTKKNLPRGKWRFLDHKEVNMLKMNIFK